MSSTQASDDNVLITIIRATTIVIVVLLVCGILSFAITAGIWHFFDIDEETDTGPNDLVFGKRIIGYFGRFEPAEITTSQLSKLTHAVYSFLQMNSNGTIEFTNEKEENRFLGLVFNSKRLTPNVKVLISIGNYNNLQSFSIVIDDPKKKRRFIDAIVSFIKEHQIDGVVLDWKLPGETNKFKYPEFLKELRQRLKEENKNYILSIEVPAIGEKHLEDGFNMDEIMDHVDFVNVFCMDYYRITLGKYIPGPSTPLYSGGGEETMFNVDHTMKYYSCKTMQPSKLNLAISFSTTVYRNLTEADQSGIEVYGYGGPRTMTQWSLEQEKWASSPVIWDEKTKSSHIYNPDNKTYLSFEANRSMKAKVDYVNEKNLGGVWIWTVGMDNKNNTLLNALCSNEFWPTTLGKTVRYEC